MERAKGSAGQDPESPSTGDETSLSYSGEGPKKGAPEAKDQGALPQQCSYFKLFSTADRWDLMLLSGGLIGSLGGGVMLPLFSIVFGDFVDSFGDPDGLTDFRHTVNQIALKFTYLAVASMVSMYLAVTCMTMVGERVTCRMRLLYLQSVLAQEVAFFDTAATTGGLLQGLNEDSMAVQTAIGAKAANFVNQMTTFGVGWIVAFVWDVALVMLGSMPFMALAGGVLSHMTVFRTVLEAAAYSKASNVAQQAISNVRTVAAYNGQQAALTKYEGALSEPLKAAKKAGLLVGMSLGGMQASMYGAMAASMFYGAYRVADGHYTGGEVVLVQIAALMSGFAMSQAAPNLQQFAAGRVAGFRMFSVIERKPKMHDVGNGSNNNMKGSSGDILEAAGAVVVVEQSHTHMSNKALQLSTVSLSKAGKGDLVAAEPAPAGKPILDAVGGGGELASVEGCIEFRDVRFAYPVRPDVQVFRGFSLVVPAGHTVALVGSSGSGKSTAVQLIERFYDPDAGCVLLDGVDLRTLGLTWLRKQMGLVSQEPTLFATTIYDNIAIGRPGATKEEVYAAAVAANAHKFVRLLPEGYQTHVGEKGVQLSGGQKQRIAIARAILKNPKVLLLDEATSALDTASERVVQAALDRMVVGRTTVVVAHRLSTVQHARAIAVVSQGQVVEQGPHAHLINKPDGAYALLVQMQMQQEAQQQREGGSEGAEALVEEGVEEGEEDEGVHPGHEADGAQVAAAPGTGGVEEQATLSVVVVDSAGKVGTSGDAPPTPSSPFLKASMPAGMAVPPPAVPLAAAAKAPSLLASAGPSAGIRPASRGGSLAGGPLGSTLSGPHLSEGGAAATRSGSLPLPDKGGSSKPAKLSEEEQEKLDEEAAKAVPMKRLLALSKPEWPALILGCAGSVGVGLQHPANAYAWVEMVTLLFLKDHDEMKRKASFWAWIYFAILSGVIIMATLQQLGFNVAGSRLAVRIRTMLLGSLLRQEVAFFDDDTHNSGRLTSALATDAAYIRGAVGDAAGMAVQNLSGVVAAYIVALAFNWQMALVVTGAFPLLAMAMVLQMQWIMGSAGGNETLYNQANQYVGEAVSSIRVIHAFNLQPYITGVYASMLAATRPATNKQAHVGGISMAFSFGLIFALYALVIYFGGWQVDHDVTDLNGMMKGFITLLMAAMGMGQAALSFPDLGKAKGAVGRVFPLLDRQPAIDPDAPGDTLAAEQVQGEVEFRDIKFAYPSRPDVVIYDNFSMHIPAGKVYALVGESGSGKSTVVSLLERFYDPLQGTVLLDGRDIRAYNLKWLRQQIGLVSQEPILFAGTVADNIRYGAPDASIEEVEAAARTANAHEFVVHLPEKYATVVGEGGIQLSGGQKQRIAIARAVIKNPKVLLLDEATSALDARSERVVQDALDVVMAGRTCLVIAHRLSTIKNAHAINVLYRGQILEQGTHAELMARPGGAYAKLVRAQETRHNT